MSTARSVRALGLATALLALLALLGLGCSDPPHPAPNLLLITVDTLRADRLACYGGQPDVGTSICALARSNGGKRFRWAFATAPSTSPSVVSILTSQYPLSHRVTQHQRSYLRDEIVTLAERLAAAGYATAAFVSNPVLDRSRRFDQGFGIYDQRMPRRERNRPGFAERAARDTTDHALAWAQTDAYEPWFLWVHYQDPHGPYEAPGAAPARDGPGERILPLADDSGHGGIPRYQVLPGVRSQQAYERRYRDEIRYLDRNVGRLVERLDALGPPPAVLLTADHGEAFGEDDFYFAHGHSVGLDQIRVPLLWRPAPETKPGESARVIDTPVSLVDVAPTLLQAAGVAAPPGFEGHPLPGASSAPAAPVFAVHGRRAAVIADGAFYSRDRDPDSTKEWGAKSPALPTRTAELPAAAGGGDESLLPGYEPAEGTARAERLEALLAEFLSGKNAGEPALLDHPPIEALEERLRALGYTE